MENLLLSWYVIGFGFLTFIKSLFLYTSIGKANGLQ
jgi:hypothetical protein